MNTQLRLFSPVESSKRAFVDNLAAFDEFGRATEIFVDGGIRYFVNEYWTARQRQSHNLHEISYRACFKAELPRFLIERLSVPGEMVYDPFMGRGTSLLEAALLGRKTIGNDINPLSAMLAGPRLDPPPLAAILRRLNEIDWRAEVPAKDKQLLVFYHDDTLGEIVALKNWFWTRHQTGKFDRVDDWIRMVALNRLTGHSSGFFSVYSLPPNQALSIESQEKINIKRKQIPPRRYVAEIIAKKTRTLLSDGGPRAGLCEALLTGPAWKTPKIQADSVTLIVTSPPFLDIVDYAKDNWLRGWFAGIDTVHIAIDSHKTVEAWEAFVRRSFEEFLRVLRPGGHIAFEVGEVRKGKVLLERNVVAATRGLPLTVLGVMVNDQDFTKTANCWGVANNEGGVNTNRIVLFRREI